MVGWGGIPWGGGGWGLGGGALAALPYQVPDEGGIILEISGIFLASRRAIITIGGANAPLPRACGGVDAVGGDPGSGHWPVTSSDGTTIRCVCPQTPIGFHDLSVTVVGTPEVIQPAAIESVRRDWWTRLHGLRRMFPTPPYPAAAVGPTQVAQETRVVVSTAGENIPALDALLHGIAAGLLEADSRLLTRLAPAPFTPGSAVRVVSNAGGDVGQVATISGLDLVGVAQTEALALNGLVPVTGALFWSTVDRVELDLVCAGTITVSDTDGTDPERIYLSAGRISKVAGALHRGDQLVVVEGTYRFPAPGELALSNEVVAYSAPIVGILPPLAWVGYNCDSVCNYFFLDAACTEDHEVGETVAGISPETTGMDLTRSSLLVDSAEAEYLTAVGRRWGAYPRPHGLSDYYYRRAIRGSALSPRGTLYSVERLLFEVYGGSPPEIVEDLVDFVETVDAYGNAVRTPCSGGNPCTVWVALGALALSTTELGRSYLCGGEAQNSTTALTVPTTYPVLLPYGVYLATDPGRAGTNYLNLYAAADGGVNGAAVTSAGNLFVAGDVGKHIVISGSANPQTDGAWLVDTFVGIGAITVVGDDQEDGTVDVGSLDEFWIGTGTPWDACPFAPRDVGRQIEILSGPAWAPATRTITAFIDRRKVQVGVVWPGATAGVAWRFLPNFPVEGALNWSLPRGTAVGSVITLATALPGAITAVLVDYSAVRSCSLLPSPAASNDPAGLYWPLYLSDDESWLRAALEEFVPAGVRVRVGTL